MENARSIKPTGIRFPQQLKELLQQAAKGEGRSLNSEVIKRLEKSFNGDGFVKA